VVRRGVIARDLDLVPGAVGLADVRLADEMTQEKAEAVARAARDGAGASHALAVLIELDAGADRIDLGGTVWLAIAHPDGVAFRRSRIVGGREWVRLGAAELALDCLRRFLQGLPVVERIDFEKV
jgi:nicotinamide-nucleotide amidase